MRGRVAKHDAGWIKQNVAKLNNATDNGANVTISCFLASVPFGGVMAIIASYTTWWIMSYLFLLIFPVIFGLVRLTLLPYDRDYDPLPVSLRIMPKLKRYGLDQIASPMIREMHEHGVAKAHDYSCTYCAKREKTIRKLESTCDGNENSIQYALEFIAARKELSA